MSKSFALGILFLFSSLVGICQQYKFNTYNRQDGLAQDFIYALNQDEKGYLWIGTGEGISRFDGKSFVNFNTSNGLAEEVITTSFKDGEYIYYGHNEGSITKYVKGKFAPLLPKQKSTSSIVGIAKLDNAIIYLTQNDGLFRFMNNKSEKIWSKPDMIYSNLRVINNRYVCVGTNLGLYVLNYTNKELLLNKHLFEDKTIGAMNKGLNEEEIVVAVNNDGIYRIKVENNKTLKSKWDGQFDFSDKIISALLIDKNESIWIAASGQGVIKFSENKISKNEEVTIYSTKNGLPSDFIQNLYEDHEGNIWIGTFGNGLATLLDDFFVFYSHVSKEYGNSVTAIYQSQSDKFFGVENGLIHINPEFEEGFKFYNQKNGLGNYRITALSGAEDKLWIGTELNGIFVLDRKTGKISGINQDLNSLEQNINSIVYFNNELWIATYGGLINYNPQTKQKIIYNTATGMPHNLIYSLYNFKNESLYIGTKSNAIYKLSNGAIEEIALVESGILNCIDITSDKQGNIWIATLENGVFKLTNSEIINYRIEDGLKSNYCYAIECDMKNQIWVGHSGGVSKFKGNRIKQYDAKQGFTTQANYRSFYSDSSGYLWMGFFNGSVRYDPNKEIDNSFPPKVTLVSVNIGEKEYDINEDINLPYGAYRIRFVMRGISFKNSEGIQYQYFLDGFDEKYSELSSSDVAYYGRVYDGEYQLKVKACNSDGVCSSETITISIKIAIPYWKKWWFIITCLVVLILIVSAIIQWRVRAHKRIQLYLETQLTIKTREVVKQKEKIEEINKDLTASINYAERIQRSMLPNTTLLTKTLPGSYVYFRPRDIVSGDFFFIQKIENLLIVACVDCTGHGVPGAFMSFIGSVSLRHIYRSQKAASIIAPNEVLEKLDQEVITILKQNKSARNDVADYFKAKDGMDLTIAEINLDTKKVRIASAMRPYIIYYENKYETVKGDRISIGGDSNADMRFSLFEHQLNSGDRLFLFTDGITDQFGGADAKKMKISGLTAIVDNHFKQASHENLLFIQEQMSLWKSNHMQLDDILLIGIEV